MKGTSRAIVRQAGLDRSGHFIIELASSEGDCTFVVDKALADKCRKGDIVTVSIEVED